MRAAVQSAWIKGMSFELLPINYPYRDVETDKLDEEGLDELLSELKAKHDQASTT